MPGAQSVRHFYLIAFHSLSDCLSASLRAVRCYSPSPTMFLRQYARFMEAIDFSQFRLMKAAPKRATILAFTVMLYNTMRINGKLKEKLQSKFINIWSGPDGTVILLGAVAAEAPEACRVFKDGKVNTSELLQTLKSLTVKVPARFIAEWNEKEKKWQGELDADFLSRCACRATKN